MTRRILAAAALVLLLSAPAHAVKVLMRMKPEGMKESGFNLTVEKRKEETLRFTLTRDTTKARWHGRSALLQVRDASGAVAQCELQVEKRGPLRTYWFDLSAKHAPHSELTFIEIQTASGTKDDPENAEKLIGGGTYYKFRLADFLNKEP